MNKVEIAKSARQFVVDHEILLPINNNVKLEILLTKFAEQELKRLLAP